jgi:hypothetical protein
VRVVLAVAAVAALGAAIDAGAYGDRTGANCPAARVDGNKVHARPFTGVIDPRYDVVDGRFRLHVGAYRNRATGLSQKIAWLLPEKYDAGEALAVVGRSLTLRRRTFRDTFQNVGVYEGNYAFPSALEPPSAGCWRLTFKTGRATGSLVVLVRGRG